MIKLSIITVVYNEAETISRTLNSIYEQTYKDFEHIIIDGASTDGTVDVINQNIQKNTIFISEKDTGIYNAMNKGIKLAKGEYLLFLNGGDSLHNSNSLADAIAQLENIDILVGSFCFVNSKESRIFHSIKEIELPYYLEIGSIPLPSTFIRKELFNIFGLYEESFKIAGDYDFFSRALYSTCTTSKVVDVLVSVFYDGGVSTNENNKKTQQEEDKYVKKNRIYCTELYKSRFLKRKLRVIKKYPLFFLNYDLLKKVIMS